MGLRLCGSFAEPANTPFTAMAYGLWAATTAQLHPRPVLGNDHQTDPWILVLQSSSGSTRHEAAPEQKVTIPAGVR